MEQPAVEVEHVGGALDQTEVPVRLERDQLRPAKVAEVTCLRLARPFEDFADGRVVLGWIAFRPPLTYQLGQPFVEVRHRRSTDYGAARTGESQHRLARRHRSTGDQLFPVGAGGFGTAIGRRACAASGEIPTQPNPAL